MKKIIGGLALAVLFGGCVIVNKNDGGESNMKVDIRKDFIHEKISVGDKKVSAEHERHRLFGFIYWGDPVSHIADETDCWGIMGMKTLTKNGAYAKACDAAKCDQLVGTRYKITTEHYFVYVKCKAEVTGYPAKLEGVEVVTPLCVQEAKAFNSKENSTTK